MSITNADNLIGPAIAGVVILYEPVEETLKNITSYIDKINLLYIIDNSNETYPFVTKFIENRPEKTTYIFNNGNLGVAAALNIAINKALEDGYSYLLTMDQDSYFEEGSLEILINSLADSDSAGIVSPFHKNRFFTNPPKLKGPEEVSDVMTSGNIINLSVIEKIGKFREDYFIDYVDIEFCLRLRKNGYKIIRVNNSLLVHNEADVSKKKIFGATVYPQNHSAVRWYYKIRNYLYLKKEYYSYFNEYFDKEKRNVRNNIIKILFFEEEKIKKINMMLKGYRHFHKKITGKFPF